MILLANSIKEKLKKKLQRRGDFYTELHTGASQADAALLTDSKFTGYEIKSSGDTLRRFIASQRKGYLPFFDEVWLVIDKKHLDKALEVLKENPFTFDCPWGLMDTDFKVYIPAKKNNRRRQLTVLGTLWRQDLLEELRSRKIKGLSKLTKAKLRRLLLSLLTPDEIRIVVRKYIKRHRENPEYYDR